VACLSVGAELLLDNHRWRAAVEAGEVDLLVTKGEARVPEAVAGREHHHRVVVLMNDGLDEGSEVLRQGSRHEKTRYLFCVEAVLGPVAEMDISTRAFGVAFDGVKVSRDVLVLVCVWYS
jgi:hypothetical protein